MENLSDTFAGWVAPPPGVPENVPEDVLEFNPQTASSLELMCEIYKQMALLRGEVASLKSELRGRTDHLIQEVGSMNECVRRIENIVPTIPGATILASDGSRTALIVGGVRASVPAPAPAPAPAPVPVPTPAPNIAPLIPVAAPTAPAGLKFAKPPMYNSRDKEKLEEFELKCAMYLDSHDPNMHDKTKINFVTGYLEGDAQKWLTPYLVKEGRTPGSIAFLNNWGLFWGELENRFGEHNKIEKYRVALGKLKQTKDVQDYLYNFQRLAQPLRYGDNDLRDRFFDGLKPEIHQMMLNTRFKPRNHTFAEVHNKALAIWEDLETYKVLHGGTTKTTEKNPQTSLSSQNANQSCTRFGNSNNVYCIVNGRAQKGQIQSIGRVNGVLMPTVKWTLSQTTDTVLFNTLRKDERPLLATPSTPKTTANSKGPAPMDLDGKGLTGVTCHICKGKGHFAQVCPSKGISGNEAKIVEVKSEEEEVGKEGAETA